MYMLYVQSYICICKNIKFICIIFYWANVLLGQKSSCWPFKKKREKEA